MTHSNRLKGLIVAAGFTQKEVSDHLGMSVQSLNKKINNRTEFKASEIICLTELLKIENLKEIFFASHVAEFATNDPKIRALSNV